MPIFEYSAAKQNGELVSGERDTENEKTLAQLLKNEGLFLLQAKEKKDVGLMGLVAGANIGSMIARLKPISILDKMFFARNLSVMIAAGLTLTKSLDALAQDATNPKMREIINSMTVSITQGKSFASSLQLHEKVFGILFINMIEVGETSGRLTLILKLLARQMKKDYDLRSRVKGAMMYPAIIVLAVFVIGGLMMVYVVPTLVQTIKELGASIPITTQMIIWLSDRIQSYSIFILGGLIAFFYMLIRLFKTKRGKYLFDRTIIRTPIFGKLIRQFNVARFSRTLAYLITSGVPIVRSLEITSTVLGNVLYQNAIQQASVEIQKGKQLHGILAHYPNLFNPLVTQMIGVGEETGTIGPMLLRIALFFEEDVTNATKNLSTLIEPILMIIIGSAVGFFVISMLQPIYSSLENL